MMTTKKYRFLPRVSILSSCLLVSSFTFARPPVDIPVDYKTGQWPTDPITHPVLPNKNMMLLAGEPKVTMVDDWKVRIDFTTKIPTRAVTIYYGMYEPDALLPWPRFRYGAKEDLDGNSTQHSVVLNLGKLKKSSVDINQMAKKGGGLVVYRLEVYSPGTRPYEIAAARLYDRRFEFYNGKLVPTVTEGPFVDQITETSAIISWDTDKPVNGTVKVEGFDDFHASIGNLTHFEVALTGLTAGTTYNYSVQVTDCKNTTTTRQYYFRTPVKNATQFTFAVLGDSRESYGGGEFQFNGVNARVVRALATNAFVKGAEFIIHTGDMINGYTDIVLDFEMQLESYKDAVESVGHYIPIYEMMGNHEVVVNAYTDEEDANALAYGSMLMFDKEGPESAEAIIANEFVNPTNGPEPDNKAANTPEGKSLPPYKENVYYFDYGNSRFVVMNNNYWYSGLPEKFGGNLEGYVLDDQMAWLTEVFSQTKADDSIDHLFLFAQEPLFPNGSQIKSGMWYQGGDPAKNGGFDRSYVVKRRDEIWRAFVGTGKAVAASFGDEHNYSRTFITQDKEGNDFEHPIWQVISGGAGAPYSAELRTDLPWSGNVKKFSTQMSYTLLKVNGDKVMLEAYNIDGILFDRVELTKDIR